MISEIITGSSDLILFTPNIRNDTRGFFLERYNLKEFHDALGLIPSFVQSNESFSKKRVLRGLHYQINKPQGKFVSVIKGAVMDMVVDLRSSSKTLGKSFSIKLDATQKKSLWIPRGYTHGFLALSDDVIFFYDVDNYYDPESEYTLLWSDPVLEIDWKISSPLVSDKDQKGLSFKDAPKFR